MKKLLFLMITLLLMVFIVAPVWADSHKAGGKAAEMLEEGLVTFVEGCETELKSYCEEVAPGEGRLLACLYAHQDKISPQCDHALLDSAIQLDRAISALTYFANICMADLNSYCLDVKPGEGRLIDCLEKNKAKLDKNCAIALEEMK
jgi:hypothetical protein